jgi:hypothetical protein
MKTKQHKKMKNLEWKRKAYRDGLEDHPHTQEKARRVKQMEKQEEKL